MRTEIFARAIAAGCSSVCWDRYVLASWSVLSISGSVAANEGSAVCGDAFLRGLDVVGRGSGVGCGLGASGSVLGT